MATTSPNPIRKRTTIRIGITDEWQKKEELVVGSSGYQKRWGHFVAGESSARRRIIRQKSAIRKIITRVNDYGERLHRRGEQARHLGYGDYMGGSGLWYDTCG